MSAVYALTLSDTVVTDGFSRTALLHDLPRNQDNWHIEALIASGDFCEMSAMTLEQIAAALPDKSVEQYQIQDVIGNLLYAQRHFKLVRKGTYLTRPVQRARDNN